MVNAITKLFLYQVKTKKRQETNFNLTYLPKHIGH